MDRMSCHVEVVGDVGPKLSKAVEQTLALISSMTGQQVDSNARSMLAALDDGAAISVCTQVLRSPTPVSSASGFIKDLASQRIRVANAVSHMLSEIPDTEFEELASHLENSPRLCQVPGLGGATSSAPRTPEPLTLQKRKCDPLSPSHERSVRPKPAQKASVARKLDMPAFGESWEAFGELPFTKRHLILKYYHPDTVMSKLTVENFKDFDSKPLSDLEAWLRRQSGNKDNLPVSFSYDTCDLEASHIGYTCKLDKRGRVKSLGLAEECEGTPLQRAFHDENVLRVEFAATKDELEECEEMLKHIQTEGLEIGLRSYQFYSYKVDKQQKKAGGARKDNLVQVKYYFLCIKSKAAADLSSPNFQKFETIQDAREYLFHFSTVKMLSKRVARMSLGLSKTVLGLSSADLSKVRVVEIPDICCKDENKEVVRGINGEDLITTDGIGFISEDLMRKCPTAIFKGKKMCDLGSQEEYPLVVQIRLFYRGSIYKGLLLLNKKLPPITLQVRLSMRKVKSDSDISSPTFDSLEVCATRQLIFLLIYGGVPENVILTFARDYLEKVTSCLKDFKAAVHALRFHVDERREYKEALKMMLTNLEVTEPFINRTLTDLCDGQLTNLSKGRIPVESTFYLKGCADPTGLLEPDEVVILIERGAWFDETLVDGNVVADIVLVYKPPGSHPGDIHKFKAVRAPPGFMAFVGSARNAIFYSVKGKRSVVDEMASADLDGDEFWVCLNDEIVKHYSVSAPWQVPKTKLIAPKPKEASPRIGIFERQHFQMGLDAAIRPNYTTGMAANAWLAFMDKFLTERSQQLKLKCERLVNVYYAALDADKTGVMADRVADDLSPNEFPHFMELVHKRQYTSTTVLGKIFDMVKDPSHSDCILQKAEIELDNQFLIPGHEAYLKVWHERISHYYIKVAQACSGQDWQTKNSKFEEQLLACREMLFGGPDFAHRTKDVDVIRLEAAAIYYLVYNRAQKKQDAGEAARVDLAWNLAGDVLLAMISKEEWWRVNPTAFMRAFGGDRRRGGRDMQTDDTECSASCLDHVESTASGEGF